MCINRFPYPFPRVVGPRWFLVVNTLWSVCVHLTPTPQVLLYTLTTSVDRVPDITVEKFFLSKSEKSRSPTNRTFRHIERASGAETCRSRRSSSLSDRWNPDAGCRFFAVPRGRRARALSRRVRVHSCAVPNKINSLFVTPFVAQVRRVIVGPVAADTNFTRTVETHRERAGLRAHRVKREPIRVDRSLP